MRKMAEMKVDQNTKKPKKPGLFGFAGFGGGEGANSKGNANVTALMQQMHRGAQSGEDWKGPTMNGFDSQSMTKFVGEMMTFQEKEFEDRLQREEIPTGIM